MKKNLLFLLIATTLASGMFAQDLLTFSAGYGSENNIGNNGINASAGYQTYIGKRFFLEAGLRYFTTAAGNQYHYRKNRVFPDEERRYNVLFFSENLGYSMGNKEKVHVNLKTGFSVFYENYKMFDGYTDTMMVRNNTIEFVRTGYKYKEDQSAALALNVGLTLNIPLHQTFSLGMGLDTYSYDLPFQFTQAYLFFTKRL